MCVWERMWYCLYVWRWAAPWCVCVYQPSTGICRFVAVPLSGQVTLCLCDLKDDRVRRSLVCMPCLRVWVHVLCVCVYTLLWYQ